MTAQGTLLEPLVTDRPDATESSSITPRGFLQIETGGFYESFEENSIKTETFTYNTTLLRLGLLNNLELRLGWNVLEQKTSNLNAVLSGFGPLLLGAKIAIMEAQKWLPKIALIGHLQLPFLAGTDYKTETTGTDFRFAFAHMLSESSSLSYNLGAQWSNDSSEAAYIYTISYGYSINDTIGWYVEFYGDFPENSKANHFWDSGFTYLLSNNFQLDATVGTSITRGQDIVLSVGISYRIPIVKTSI